MAAAGRIYFDGVDLSSEDYGVTVTAANVSNAATRDISHTEIPYSPGGISRVIGPQQRQISVTAVQVGDTPADSRAKHDRLMCLLTQPETRQLILDLDDRWPDRYWDVLLTSAPAPDAVRQHRVQRFNLTFSVPGAYGYSTTLTERTVTLASDPTAVNETPGGSAIASPVYEIENLDDYDATPIKIANTSTGDSITWGGSLGTGDILRVDTHRQLVEISTDGGTSWTASMASLDSGHKWPRLRPLTANSLEVSGVSDGAIDISYRDTYL